MGGSTGLLVAPIQDAELHVLRSQKISMKKRQAPAGPTSQSSGMHWLISISLLCCGLIIALGLAGASGGARPPKRQKHPRTISAVTAGALHNFALSFAATNGDSSPATAEAVATDRMSALSVADPGDIVVDVNPPSYLIIMTGGFTALAKGPPGAAAPTGPVLWVVVSASDYSVEDFGLSMSIPNIASLGPVANLLSHY